MRPLLLWTGVSLCGLTVACDNPTSNMGFTFSGSDDKLLILYKTCHTDTKVYRVALYDTDGTKGDATDDTLLWEIVSSEGTLVRGFVVGEPSTGFETTKALSEPPPDRSLLVSVSTDELDEDEEFIRMKDLQRGRIRLRDKNATAEEFAKYDSCG